MSSTPLSTTRTEPAVNRLLPPDSSSGAASSISTDAPCSCAASAAQKAALPPPTTMTSASNFPDIPNPSRLLSQPRHHSAATAVPPWAFDQPVGSCMNFSTSASLPASNLPLCLATASTSHQVAR